MIDRFAFPILSTVEGNINNGTATRQLDLTSLDHLQQLYFITRPAQQIVEPPAGQIAAPRVPTGAGDPGAGLVQLLLVKAHNERLHAVFSKLAGNTTPYDAPVHAWGH
ncbi:MAG: hypothetical protein H7138_05905 [Myxococcales bacterium]|nr:hypothetical protein [Myxococcales bacterium]